MHFLTSKTHIDEVVKQLTSPLKGFIRNRVKSTEDAEDILQDVFYELAEADQLMRPIEQISAWLYTVARNRITDSYRKKKPEPIAEFYSDNEEDELFTEIQQLLTSPEDSPETEYLKSLIWTELDKALAELPPEQRLAFEWNELEGMSFRDISLMTGEPQNTLISRKRYAVLHLRERLGDLYEELINY